MIVLFFKVGVFVLLMLGKRDHQKRSRDQSSEGNANRKGGFGNLQKKKRYPPGGGGAPAKRGLKQGEQVDGNSIFKGCWSRRSER